MSAKAVLAFAMISHQCVQKGLCARRQLDGVHIGRTVRLAFPVTLSFPSVRRAACFGAVSSALAAAAASTDLLM
jgi:hypothetical protein